MFPALLAGALGAGAIGGIKNALGGGDDEAKKQALMKLSQGFQNQMGSGMAGAQPPPEEGPGVGSAILDAAGGNLMGAAGKALAPSAPKAPGAPEEEEEPWYKSVARGALGAR